MSYLKKESNSLNNNNKTNSKTITISNNKNSNRNILTNILKKNTLDVNRNMSLCKYNKNINTECTLTSNEKVNRSEYLKLNSNYLNSIKLSEKQEKKIFDLIEELKKVKNDNDIKKKEIAFLLANLEKLKFNDINNTKTLNDNKILIRKLENRLIQGSKSQNLLDLNNDLKEQIEGYIVKLDLKDNDLNSFKEEIKHKELEIKKLRHALEIRFNSLKYPDNLKASLLYDLGSVKVELDETKDHLQTLKEVNANQDKELKDKSNKLQELEFSKKHIAEVLIKSEENLNNLENENNKLKQEISKILIDNTNLTDYLNRLEQDYKDLKSNYLFSNEENQKEKLLNNKENNELTYKLKEISDKNNYLINKLNESSNNFEKIEIKYNEIKKKFNNQEVNINKLENDNKLLNQDILNITKENQNLIKKIDTLNKNLYKIEEENSDLFSKNKKLLFNQENNFADILNENNRLKSSEKKLKDIIDNTELSNEKLIKEKEELKKMFDEIKDKYDVIICDKEEIIKELELKKLQIDKLKNKNIDLVKKYNKFISKSNINSDEKDDKDNKNLIELCEKDLDVINDGNKKIEENNLLNIIRIEKQKNKNFLEEIKKIKNTLKN